MTASFERDRKLEELFQLAADLSDREREAFFARHCADDPGLRTDLEELLLQDDEGTKDFLVSPVLGAREPESDDAGTTEGNGLPGPGSSYMPERIDRYLILERIGEGGMGSVYLAEQEHPVRRRVALKIVKPGMDTERVIQRFEMERQALAVMDHPCIARIFDAGATESGRPYFVMEYAPGSPINRFCDEESLDVAQRLELFCMVCEAVQHAHQKGIIHRDIKPRNVLVSRTDGRIVPKVIDFGIARATTETAEEHKQKTRATEVVGTSYYMSPEQADPGGGVVDTRTDIYSLGVLLYELLTGVLPFDSGTFRDKTVAEVQTFLRDTDPPPPSTRVSKLGDTTTRIAAKRSLEPSALVSLLSGDLDWITMKSMEKEPGRRYATATGLAADVRRHLADEPVVAGPPDVAYRVRKFIRRNRATVVSGSLVVIALVAGIIGTTWGMLEAAQQRDEALTAKAAAETAETEADLSREEAVRQREAADRLRGLAEEQRDEALSAKAKAEEAETDAREQRAAAEVARGVAENLRELAQDEARQSQSVTDFLVNTVALVDPEVSMDPDPSLETVLLRAGERIEKAFQGFPEGEATVRKALGEALHSLGSLEAAEVHLRRALDIQTSLENVSPEELYATQARLALVYGESDSHDAFDLSARSSRLAVGLIGGENRDLRHELDHLISDVMSIDVEHAAYHLDSVIMLSERMIDTDDARWLILADVFEFLGYHLGYHWGSTTGIPYLEETLTIRTRVLAPTHPQIARAMNRLVTVLNLQERHEQAEQLVRRSLVIYVSAFPEGHWLLAETRSLLGECLSGQGNYIEAEEYLLPSHEDILTARGLVSRAGIDSTYRLVRHYEATERPAETLAHRAALAQAFAFSRNTPWNWGKQAAAFGTEHAELVAVVETLDSMMMEATRMRVADEAYMWQLVELIDDVISLRKQVLSDEDPRSVIIARLLAEYSEVEWGQTYEIDRRMGEEVYRVLAPHQDRLPVPLANSLMLLGRIASFEESDPARAEDLFGQAWELRRSTWGAVDEQTLEAQRRLAFSQVAQGHHEQARGLLALTWEECMANFGPRHYATIDLLLSLSEVFDAWERPTALETYLEKHLRLPAAEDRDVHRLELLSHLAARTAGFSEKLYGLALSAADRAIELHPTHESHIGTSGKVLYRLGRHGEAIAALETALELSGGKYLDAWVFLALARRASGDEEGSQAARGELRARLPDYHHDFELERFLEELQEVVEGD